MNKENFIFKVKIDLHSNGIDQDDSQNEKVNKSKFNSNVFNNNDLNNKAKHFIVVSELNLVLLEITDELKAIGKLILCTSLTDLTLIKIKSSLNTIPKIGILLNAFELIKYLEITLFDSIKEQFFTSLIEKRQDGLRKDFNLTYEDLYFKRDMRMYSNNIYSSYFFNDEIIKNQSKNEIKVEKSKFHSFNDKSISLKDFVEDKDYNRILEDTKPKNKLKFSNVKNNNNIQDTEKLDKDSHGLNDDFFLLKDENQNNNHIMIENHNSKHLIDDSTVNVSVSNDLKHIYESEKNHLNESNFTYYKTTTNDFSIKKYFKLNKSQVMNCYFINYPDELIKLKVILRTKKEIFKNLFDQDSVFAKPNIDLTSKEIIYIYQILIEAFSFLDKSKELKENLQEMNEFIYSFKLNK